MERKILRTVVPGSEKAWERKGLGAKVPGSELARVLLAAGANWPGSEKARYPFNYKEMVTLTSPKMHKYY